MSVKWLTAGVALALAGLAMLLRVAGSVSLSLMRLWPLLPIWLGATYARSGWTRRSRSGALVVGGVLMTYGAMFLACEIMGWSLMARIWPGFLLGPALGLRQHYKRFPNSRGARLGALVLGGLGGVLLLGMFIPVQVLIPAGMIAAGVAMLMSVLRRVR